MQVMLASLRYLASLTTVVFVIVVALNLVAYALLPRDRGSPIDKYGLPTVMQAYAGWTEAQVALLLEESYGPNMALRYHPFAAFRNPHIRGQYVNIHEAGFRLTPDTLPWPPPGSSFPIFVFGGSTAFGLGVQDSGTIAVAMQRTLLRASTSKQFLVYNFGVPAYFSSQELALFNDLLRDGHAPRVAVFLDGLNEFAYSDGRPEFFYSLSHLMSAKGDMDAFYSLPLVQFVQGRGWRAPFVAEEMALDPARARADVQRVIERWDRNARAILALADAFGVRAEFVWQPVPTYKYDLKSHLFTKAGKRSFGVHRLSAVGYREAEGQRSKTMLGKSLWLADIQEFRKENLYVDLVHYSPEFSADIGERIASYLIEKGAID